MAWVFVKENRRFHFAMLLYKKIRSTNLYYVDQRE